MGISRQIGETFVFAGTEEQIMRYWPLSGGGRIHLRSQPEDSYPDSITFTEGIDYTVDYEKGTLTRIASGRLPDWQQHPLYGLPKFDHREFANVSNRLFTVYADYDYEAPNEGAVASGGMSALWREKLQNKKAISYVVLGDSISAGAEILNPHHTFAERFREHLREQFPHAEVTLTNKAISGEASPSGLQRLQADVIAASPDLVTIGYGMNDQNVSESGGNGVPLQAYEQNVAAMIERIQAQTDAVIILITPCLPNVKWHFASENVTDYADALRRLAQTYKVGLADVQQLWHQELAAGKSQASLLINHINHPNEYGHALYAKALSSLV
ncbi:SGNH/GDSL hydrolase family protein [Paenibacillus sp. HWE-109]|uniref:SGNH/GDSL hydrolase family protein n=1 Tax=Paenibacillus sp. HWE-109 TaxID=1306526 RepID=UPI001EE151F0|nr:SGNH/GDSL hydrolase family protein [Paenibacillus sp. HWE-109]UKS28728.1 SGNH/GDSL hydrolase family protein [Paenibacillus sp. HWE-109]